MKKLLTLVIVLPLLIIGLSVLAQDKPSADPEDQMPPTSPKQLEKVKFLVGTWDVSGTMRMDVNIEEWTPFESVCTYKFVSGGSVLYSEYESMMMGMEFIGVSLQTFDNENNVWQTTWADNMGHRISIYTGEDLEGKFVFTGEDKFLGKVELTRITMSELTPTTFKWQMESSKDNGETWGVTMKADYTKK